MAYLRGVLVFKSENGGDTLEKCNPESRLDNERRRLQVN